MRGKLQVGRVYSTRCMECTGKPVLKRFITEINGENTTITLPRFLCFVCHHMIDKNQSRAIENYILRLLAVYGGKFDVPKKP